MVSRSNDDFDVASDVSQKSGGFIVLLCDVLDCKLLFLVRIDAYTIHNISSDNEIFDVFCNPSLIFCTVFTVYPVNESLKCVLKKCKASDVNVGEEYDSEIHFLFGNSDNARV